MHPSKDILERFASGLIDDGALEADIKDHLGICEFCREYCRQYEQFLRHIAEEERTGKEIPELEEKASILYRQVLRGRSISLTALLEHRDSEQFYLAADGRGEEKIRNLATFYSEKPEVVLRVMRDTDRDYDYAQIISDDPDLTANVMIRLPEIDREFIVDDSGRTRIDGLEDLDVEKVKWQIKLPQAVFAVDPLKYDPDHTEEEKDFILESGKGDRLRVMLERKTEGIQISIQVLEIDGKADFSDARVSVMCRSLSQIRGSSPGRLISFGPIDIAEKIYIRIFT